MSRFLNLQGEISPLYDEFCSDLGAAIWLLQSSGQGRFTIAAAAVWLIPAIRHGQIKFIYFSDGRPCGFASWAFVNDETLGRLQSDDGVLNISEWNEGLNLWIMSVVCLKGLVRAVVRAVRDELGGRHNVVHGLRRRADGNVRRRVRLKVRNGADVPMRV